MPCQHVFDLLGVHTQSINCDDLISGGAGDDAIDGGDGADIVQFSGNWADYTITENAGVYTVVHKNAGADGTDTVIGDVWTFRTRR